jgi:transposase InsO family protein
VPTQRWAGDTTELRIGESGRLFLVVIIDLFFGFAVASSRPRQEAVSPSATCWPTS